MRVGLVHSLAGMMAVVEKGLVAAELKGKGDGCQRSAMLAEAQLRPSLLEGFRRHAQQERPLKNEVNQQADS